MSQRRILYGRLESLERSRKGHLLSVTKACNALDKSLEDFGNVIKVRIQQTQVNNAFLSMLRYDDLLDASCKKYWSVLSDRDTQPPGHKLT